MFPRSRIALAIENSTALPSPPPSSSTFDFSGISVGAPVGPITTTGSPFFRYAHSRLDTPSSSAMSDSSPFSLSTQAPVSAMPSISSGVPLTRRATDS